MNSSFLFTFQVISSLFVPLIIWFYSSLLLVSFGVIGSSKKRTVVESRVRSLSQVILSYFIFSMPVFAWAANNILSFLYPVRSSVPASLLTVFVCFSLSKNHSNIILMMYSSSSSVEGEWDDGNESSGGGVAEIARGRRRRLRKSSSQSSADGSSPREFDDESIRENFRYSKALGSIESADHERRRNAWRKFAKNKTPSSPKVHEYNPTVMIEQSADEGEGTVLDASRSEKECAREFRKIAQEILGEEIFESDTLAVARFLAEEEGLSSKEIYIRATQVLRTRPAEGNASDVETEIRGENDAETSHLIHSDAFDDNDDSFSSDEDVIQGKKRRRSSRYFSEADISTKCHRCGKVGHMKFECPNEECLRPCYICAHPGHEARECTQRPCYRCGSTGHLAEDCTALKRTRRRDADDIIVACMKTRKSMNGGMASVRCMVCDGLGHIMCSKNARQSRTQLLPVWCSNCGERGHTHRSCDRPLEREGGDSKVTCYLCGKDGHIKAHCPTNRRRTSYDGRYQLRRPSLRSNVALESRRSRSVPPRRSGRGRYSPSPPRSHWRGTNQTFPHGHSSYPDKISRDSNNAPSPVYHGRRSRNRGRRRWCIRI